MRICVLVVDDERPILGAIARAQVDKWVITLCVDAESALDILRSPAEFDAIVLDLFLGGRMTGQELFEMLKADPATAARIPRIIFQTGGYDHATLIPWFEKAGRPVLSKPVPLDEFERVVTKVASWKGPRGPRFTKTTPEAADAFLTHLEERVIKAIQDTATARDGRDDDTPVRSISPSGRHRTLSAIADDPNDDSIERTQNGGLRIPPGSWLEREINATLEKREKQAALELAAGKWARLRLWWFEWWRKLALAAIAIGAGAVAREGGELVAWLLKHVK